MSKRHLLCALVAVTLACGAGTEKSFAESSPPVSRETPIVRAVKKAQPSIVLLKGERRGGSRQTIGTGVIVDDRGYILTNAHVVHSAERIVASLADGTELSAQVYTADARADLALLEVKPTTKLTEIRLGPSSDVMVGETVIAIGNPYGYANTVSTGIVSGLGRDIGTPGGDRLKDLIQMTASINPGNSGGPLLNINGELIGINVAMRDGAQNICFSIPSQNALVWLSQVLSAKAVAKVSHGITAREKITKSEGEDRQQVIVEAVAENSPAAAAGIKAGDVLVKVGNRTVTNRFDVERALWNLKDGKKLAATVVREGKERVVQLEASGEVTTASAPR